MVFHKLNNCWEFRESLKKKSQKLSCPLNVIFPVLSLSDILLSPGLQTTLRVTARMSRGNGCAGNCCRIEYIISRVARTYNHTLQQIVNVEKKYAWVSSS